MKRVLLLSLLMLGLAAEAGWLEPNIVNPGDGSGWVKVKTVFDPPPFPPWDDKHSQPDAKITVLLAALRETRCAATLHSFYVNASHPERVYFGVVQQNNELEDDDCLEEYCKLMEKPLKKTGLYQYENPNSCPFFSNIRMLRMKDTEAKGPVYARGRQPELVFPQDDFCMQIDAHSVVVQGWDKEILSDWGKTNNEYAVLTAYPTNVHDLGVSSNKHWEMPHMCGAAFEGKGIVRNDQASACANLDVPILSPLWAAGLSFHRCHAERNVPNDWRLKDVFSGEEFSRGARLWTHGYDFYSMRRPILGTYYGGEKGGKGWWQGKAGEAEFSRQRMMTLLRFPGSDQSEAAYKKLEPLFRLGTRRSLEQYAAFSGINTMTEHVERRCHKLDYVPWTQHPYTEFHFPAKSDHKAPDSLAPYKPTHPTPVPTQRSLFPVSPALAAQMKSRRLMSPVRGSLAVPAATSAAAAAAAAAVVSDPKRANSDWPAWVWDVLLCVGVFAIVLSAVVLLNSSGGGNDSSHQLSSKLSRHAMRRSRKSGSNV